MELPTTETFFLGGAGRVDTVGVRGSNPLSRTIKIAADVQAETFGAARKLRHKFTAVSTLTRKASQTIGRREQFTSAWRLTNCDLGRAQRDWQVSLTLRGRLASRLRFPWTVQENQKGRGSVLLLEVSE